MLYSSVKPRLVITLLVLYFNKFLIILINCSGIFKRCIAFHKCSLWTKSYAFDISCNKIHNSFLFSRASSITLLRICNGSFVDLPGKAAKLLSPNISQYSVKIFVKRFVSIFIKNFLGHSNSVIGLVLSKFKFQSPGLGIGYITPFDQSIGISSALMHSLKNFLKSSFISPLLSFRIS